MNISEKAESIVAEFVHAIGDKVRGNALSGTIDRAERAYIGELKAEVERRLNEIYPDSEIYVGIDGMHRLVIRKGL